jgi:hypothetical protein
MLWHAMGFIFLLAWHKLSANTGASGTNHHSKPDFQSLSVFDTVLHEGMHGFNIPGTGISIGATTFEQGSCTLNLPVSQSGGGMHDFPYRAGQGRSLRLNFYRRDESHQSFFLTI